MNKIELTINQLDHMSVLTRSQCIQYGFTYPAQKGWKKELRQRILESRELNPTAHTEPQSNVILNNFFEE